MGGGRGVWLIALQVKNFCDWSDDDECVQEKRVCTLVPRDAQRAKLTRNDAVDSAQEALLFIVCDVIRLPIVVPTQGADFEVCRNSECAAKWRKARRDGWCYECLRADSVQQVS